MMLKLVVWDLDGTLWDGIYIYDGEDVIPKPQVLQLIQRIEGKNVLQSIISRNPPEVKDFVEKLGLLEHFVLPKISWVPKNQAMYELLSEVHILPKDVAFIDDDEFELNLIKSSFPEITCIKADSCDKITELLPSRPSKSNFRKQFFKQEEERLNLKKGLKSEEEFMQNLDIVLEMKHASDDEMERVVELINRTNQLNSTGRRFTDIKDFRNCYERNDIVVGYPLDRFGSYGLSIVAVFKRRDDTIVVEQFINSCRVIDRSILIHFLKELQEHYGTPKVNVRYVQTKYNYVLKQELQKMGFVQPLSLPDCLYVDKPLHPLFDINIKSELS